MKPTKYEDTTIKPEGVSVIFEGESGWRDTSVINFSGYEGPDQYLIETNLRPWLSHLAGKADKLVVYLVSCLPTQAGLFALILSIGHSDPERSEW